MRCLYNVKLYALPIEAQVTIVLEIYDTTGLTQPNARTLKGQACLEHRKIARLTVDSVTTYIIPFPKRQN